MAELAVDDRLDGEAVRPMVDLNMGRLDADEQGRGDRKGMTRGRALMELEGYPLPNKRALRRWRYPLTEAMFDKWLKGVFMPKVMAVEMAGERGKWDEMAKRKRK